MNATSTSQAAKPHVSYSSITSWLHCGESYRLQKIAGAPEVPAWWSIGGSAVHTATEVLDHASNPAMVDYEAAFTDAFQQQSHMSHSIAPDNAAQGSTPDEGQSSRYPTRASRGQDADWWAKEGPLMVKRWLDWRAETGWSIWTTPDGRPAIELAAHGTIGGQPVKAFIDRVMVTPAGELVIVDLKTGTRKPSSTMQLGFYALLLEQTFGVRPSIGCYWMARKGEATEAENLDKYTDAYLGRFTNGLAKARDLGVYLPNPSSMCVSCGVAYACWAVGGPDAGRYA